MYAQYMFDTMSHSSYQGQSIQQHNMKSDRADIPPPGVEKQHKDQSKIRHQRIAEAAYSKSDARTIEAGFESDDWRGAEDHIKSLITGYLSDCEEDGGLSIVSLQRLAREIGIENPEIITTINQLVRSIQQASHQRPCFRFEQNMLCKDKNCQWSSECQRLIAEWMR